jgi:hypothetical protein
VEPRRAAASHARFSRASTHRRSGPWLLVDNASTDKTPAVIDAFSSSLPLRTEARIIERGNCALREVSGTC